MLSENPSIIQDPRDFPWIENVRDTPLVLIHDGGGTTFSYWCLGELHRVLYGIHNPCYNTERTWAGGIPEMAAAYAKLVKTVHPRGPVILGGWSLGGMVSVAVAHIFADDPDVDVLGIVMVDSVAPDTIKKEAIQIHEDEISWGANTREETRRAIMACFRESTRMIRDWTLPTWEDAGAKDSAGSPRTWRRRPPPAILLRATETVPLAGRTSRVDLARDDRLLGWGNYRDDLIAKVVDIPGHHFNIFAVEENTNAVTEAIKQACDDIEQLAAAEAGAT
ncbi:alpha/beta-hydrolase [Thozetella sp. PMI_491]|nr:alpha/beta-hydrolase [Thozetella sp. PMI_491]